MNYELLELLWIHRNMRWTFPKTVYLTGILEILPWKAPHTDHILIQTFSKLAHQFWFVLSCLSPVPSSISKWRIERNIFRLFSLKCTILSWKNKIQLVTFKVKFSLGIFVKFLFYFNFRYLILVKFFTFTKVLLALVFVF